MTINEIKQEIVEFLSGQSEGLTARQISTEMMLQDDHKRVTQALSMLKSEGFVHGEVHYSDEDAANRVHYSLDRTCKELAEELANAQVPEVTKIGTDTPWSIYEDDYVYEVVFDGKTFSTEDNLDSAMKSANHIAIDNMSNVEIYKVTRKLSGTVVPEVTTTFEAA